MQEGDYTFQLTVSDSAGQQDTSKVTVIVQPGVEPTGLGPPTVLLLVLRSSSVLQLGVLRQVLFVHLGPSRGTEPALWTA